MVALMLPGASRTGSPAKKKLESLGTLKVNVERLTSVTEPPAAIAAAKPGVNDTALPTIAVIV